jgi:PAS domain S-box-containing protein
VREVINHLAVALCVCALTTVFWWLRLSRARKQAAAKAANAVSSEVAERTAALEEVIEVYRGFVENSDAISFEYDEPRRRITYIAPQVERLLAASTNRVRREFLGTLIHPDDRKHVMASLTSYAAGGDSERVALQYRLVRDDGRVLYVRTLLSERTDEGVIRGLTIDVTQMTKLEREVREAQKLESVGRLAAGVAHEINTPVQYVQDSVQFTSEAIADLFGVIERHRAITASVVAGTASAEAAARALAEDEHADLEYLIEHVPPALTRATDGLGRVTTIVHSLKSFAHPDQRERTHVDINAAILTTLEVARHEYKYVADIALDLGPLPQLECFAGEINQVLLALIVNASHAIEDARDRLGERGVIRVKTHSVGNAIEIAISDTGCGIPERLRERVFEPFFTTKKHGRGTGQGLSVARSVVVDKHGGSLSFDTAVGKGTTFTIRLPVTSAARGIGVAA